MPFEDVSVLQHQYERADEDAPKSRFSYRDLRLLSQAAVSSPLRVIALLDFDCFYAQCEAVRLGLPATQPLGVQQFKHVIAINYPARAAGLKKVVTAVEAKEKCSDIVLQHVPTWREGDTTWRYRDDVEQFMDSDKSSLDYYRLQSRRAIEVVKSTLPQDPEQLVEKASIDEVFLDLSAQVHAVMCKRYPDLLVRSGDESLNDFLPRPDTEVIDWHESQLIRNDDADDAVPEITDWDDIALSIGAEIVRDLRREILAQLQYTCSAGVAHNKLLAKLAAGHNKPNKQTVILKTSVSSFLADYKLAKLRGLGGKLGQEVIKAFSTEQISDLLTIPLKEMQLKLGSQTGASIYRTIRGTDTSEVTPRTQIQSMLSVKTFTPDVANLEQAERWLRIFTADIVGRLADQEGRRPKTIAVHHQIRGRFGPTRSKQTTIPAGSKVDISTLFKLSRDLLLQIEREGPSWPCLCLSIGVSDFYDTDRGSHSIKSMFSQMPAVSLPSRTQHDQHWYDPSVSSVHDVHEATNSIDGRTDPKNTQGTAMTPSTTTPKKRTILDFQGFKTDQFNQQETTHPLITPHRHQHHHQSSKKPRHNFNNGGDEHTSQIYEQHQAPNNHEDEDEIKGENDAKEGEDKYICPKCHQAIEADDVLEHLDWHMAMDLQSLGSSQDQSRI